MFANFCTIWRSLTWSSGRHCDKFCHIKLSDVRKMSARCAQDVRMMCARCAQYVCKMYAYVMFDIIEPRTFRKYSTCWVLEKAEERFRILKKFVHACVVNVIHAKVWPDFVLYIEHSMKVKVNYKCIWAALRFHYSWIGRGQCYLQEFSIEKVAAAGCM